MLADEINRASPKTQSALLEAMAEAQVTVDGTTYQLASPFMVIATQNPIEHEGTYPLPESQLDRFLMRVSVGYPSTESELEILDTHGDHDAFDDIGSVITDHDVQDMVDAAKAVHVAPALKSYLVDLANASRRHPHLALGMSPRATLALQRVARARAAASGRTYVVPDDLKALAEPVLAHRLLVTPEAQLQGITRRRRPHRGAAGRARPGRQGPVGQRVLTRQGWLVGLGAVALLAAGRDPRARRALRPRGRRGRAARSAAALLVGTARLELEVGRADPPRPGARRHRQPRRPHHPQPARHHAPPCCGCAIRCRAPAAPTCSCRRSGAAERTIAAYRLPTDRRGLVQIGPLEVVVGDPFGLTSLATVAAPKVALTVYPHVDQIDPLPYTTGHDPLAGARQPNSLGRTGEDFYALRPYVVGDDLRRIHWPTSARHDELLVRQNELPWQGRTTVLLDVRKAAHAGDSLEVAVSAAASIVVGDRAPATTSSASSRPPGPTPTSRRAPTTSRRSWSTSRSCPPRPPAACAARSRCSAATPPAGRWS